MPCSRQFHKNKLKTNEKHFCCWIWGSNYQPSPEWSNLTKNTLANDSIHWWQHWNIRAKTYFDEEKKKCLWHENGNRYNTTKSKEETKKWKAPATTLPRKWNMKAKKNLRRSFPFVFLLSVALNWEFFGRVRHNKRRYNCYVATN